MGPCKEIVNETSESIASDVARDHRTAHALHPVPCVRLAITHGHLAAADVYHDAEPEEVPGVRCGTRCGEVTVAVKVSAAMARKLGVTPALRRRVTKAVAKVQPYPIDAMCLDAGLPVPLPEFEFAFPDRKWRWDFAWVPEKIALEIQGALFTRGRHTRGAALLKEHEKLNAGAIRGWRVLYTTPKDVRSGKVLELIREALHGR